MLAGKAEEVPAVLGTQITDIVHRYPGLTINPHLFRHIAAKLYLDVRAFSSFADMPREVPKVSTADYADLDTTDFAFAMAYPLLNVAMVGFVAVRCARAFDNHTALT